MQIIVDIPNSLYANLKKIQNHSIASKRILDCVKNGVPLPEVHGRLIDSRELITDIHKSFSDDLEILQHIVDAPTIIEASMEG